MHQFDHAWSCLVKLYLIGTIRKSHAIWDTCRTECAIALHRKTKTNTNPDPNPDPNRYRRRCPDPNARIQKFILNSTQHATQVATKGKKLKA